MRLRKSSNPPPAHCGEAAQTPEILRTQQVTEPMNKWENWEMEEREIDADSFIGLQETQVDPLELEVINKCSIHKLYYEDSTTKDNLDPLFSEWEHWEMEREEIDEDSLNESQDTQADMLEIESLNKFYFDDTTRTTRSIQDDIREYEWLNRHYDGQYSEKLAKLYLLSSKGSKNNS